MGRKKQLTILGILFYLLSPQLHADSIHQSISNPTQLGTSARSLALGSIEGVNATAFAIFENPASLPQDSKRHYSAFYTTLADKESAYFTTSVAYPFYGGEMGFGIAQKRSPNLDFTEENSDGDFYSASKFAVQENIYKLGYARKLNHTLSAGASIHYYMHDLLLTKGTGWNADIGFLFTSNPFVVSLSLKNIIQNSKVTFSNDYSTLNFPSELVLSSRYCVTNSLRIFGQFSGKNALKAGGIEYAILPTFDVLMGVKEIEAAGKHTQYSLGASIKLSPVHLNFSYQKTDVVGNDGLYGVSLDLAM